MFKKNLLYLTLLIYILAYVGIIYFKPNFIYNNKGQLREFGIGTRNKTVLPLWLVSIVIAIFSYYIVLLIR